MKTTEKITVNALKHRIEKTIGKYDYVIDIKLADECRNGHNDFSITGSIYEAGKRNDRYCLSGGAIGDKIAKKMPSLKIFNNLHLCDVNGAPMYAIGNGFYHLKKGFNSTNPNDKDFKAQYCEYYRLTPEQFDAIALAEDEMVFAYLLEELGIIKQWKEEAVKAIQLLEEMTGEKFEDNSVKLQKVKLSKKDKAEIKGRISAGYYTKEKIQERAEAKKAELKQKQLDEIKADYDASVKKEHDEYLVKRAVLLSGLSIDNFIYYNHSNEGVFNWHTNTYNKAITTAEFDGFIDWVKLEKPELPKGIVFKLGK